MAVGGRLTGGEYGTTVTPNDAVAVRPPESVAVQVYVTEPAPCVTAIDVPVAPLPQSRVTGPSASCAVAVRVMPTEVEFCMS